MIFQQARSKQYCPCIGPTSKKAGFSLVELMVSIGIFVMITSITLTNYPKFSNKLSLDLLAQDIALSLRQAQVSGSSVLGAKSGGAQTFGAYGIHFGDPSPPPQLDTTSGPYQYAYLLYADIVGNPANRSFQGSYKSDSTSCSDPTAAEECVQKFLITGRNKVRAICANFEAMGITPDERAKKCDDISNGDLTQDRLSWLDVVFVRPNLDAKFFAEKTLSRGVVGDFSDVGIVLASPSFATTANGQPELYYETIVIRKTGQISVE